MEEIKQPTKVISLVQKSGTYNYKLIIPAEVERKIRFACQKVWSTEWSGTLFFTHEGSFENNDLVIRCVDIYIMDIGTQAYTEFDMNPDVIAYMCENPELLDCQMGLIHSHNNMSTFFSGTDTATLKEEGRDRNNFVSLIVNNAGTYTAAITRRVKRYSQIKDMLVYEFFGDGEKHDTKKYASNADEIEWFYLKIEKEGENYSFPDMDARLEEIKQAKAEKAKKAQTPTYQGGYKPVIANSYGTKAGPANLVKKEANKPEVVQPTFFDDIDDLPFEEEYDMPYGQVSFDKVTLKLLVLQLITGSIIISNDSKIDITKWAKSMPALYEKRFGKGEEGMENFKMWADTYAEYLTWYVTDEKLEELGFDETEICAICAHDMIEELTKLPENDYIKGYIDALQKYLIL
ncbi:metalloprotease domain protein [uncultured phage cr44_1]|uniref:Metalloprotease domain protein n=1 Tax=uncultured phage cr44_1 TaxID=2986405 RepID=A0AAE7RV00_9CAUD|nr:metalloprotease domain protein [uncultured phage cr44_1]QWM89916.1 metalloprotease domain protein [uncultured phage cr44_1]